MRNGFAASRFLGAALRSASILGLGLFLPSASAFAVTTVTSCGEDLNVAGETYVLTGSLTGCSGTGLTISADDVTLDCLCSTLAGDGVNDIPTLGSDWAILVTGARATIQNCRMQDFHIGIFSFGEDTTVDFSEITSLDEIPGGVSEAVAFLADRGTLTNSYIHDTDNYAGVGFFFADNRAENNVIERIHNCPGPCLNAAGTPFGGYGVAVFGGTDNVIKNNRFNDLDDAAVQIWGGTRLLVEGNIIENIIVPALPVTGDAPASAAIYDRGGVDMTVRDNLFRNISIRDGLLATAPPHGELIELASSGTVLIENNELDASATNNGVNYFNATDLSTVTIQNNNFTAGSGFDHLATGVINGPLNVATNWYGAPAASGTTNDAVNITPTGPGQLVANVVNASAPMAIDVGLNPLCESTVFLSSTTSDGNLGGVAGADQQCTVLAALAGLPGTKYKAWLSDGSAGPLTTFFQSSSPYKLIDGTQIAADFADLIDGTLDAPINITENGDVFDQPSPGQRVWTGTSANGVPRDGGALCSDWTLNSSFDRGAQGRFDRTNSTWSYSGASPCNRTRHLYCFQQPALPDPEPTPGPRTVFLSSTQSNGNLGGLAGADAKCNALAAAESLPGTYAAWLSDDSESPSTRFSMDATGYFRVDSTLVAVNFADLTDGSLLAPINVSEAGDVITGVSAKAWTGSNALGIGLDGAKCSEWTSGSSVPRGANGLAGSTSSTWSFSGAAQCSQLRRLYCIQQSDLSPAVPETPRRKEARRGRTDEGRTDFVD